MARVDKVVTAGRTYSVVLLTLTIAVAAVTATEVTRWLLLGKARTALSHWIACDFLTEDFEDWWYRQKTSGSKVSDPFTLSADLRNGRERYYTGLGSAFVQGQGFSWSISVRQPSRSVNEAKGLPSIPDVRADIPDLLPWTDRIDLTELTQKILEQQSPDDAAIEEGKLALNNIYKTNHPEVTARLPAILKEEWSVDNRWLTLGSEKEKAALQLREIARAARVNILQDSFPPAIYRDAERILTTSTVKVPVIDTEMPTQNALWVLAVLVFLNAVVLQATLERLESEKLQEREELWLLLDATPGVSRVLSTIWLSITLVSPVLVPVVVLVVILLRATAGGGSVVGAFASGSPLVLLALGGSWCSTKICRILKRATSQTETVPASAQASSGQSQSTEGNGDTVITDDAGIAPALPASPAPADPSPPR